MDVRVERRKLAGRVHERLREVAVLLDDGDRGAVREIGLTPAHVILLRLLEPDAADAAGRTITNLAERMLCTRGNATRLVQRLVEAGLVVTRADPADQRLVRVHLTAEGAERLAAARRRQADLDDRRFAELTDGQLRQLRDLLDRVADLLTAHNGA